MTGLSLESARVRAGETVRVSVTVTNRGTRPGSEVLRVHVSDRFASVSPPVERLRAFRKIRLDPGETRTELLAFPTRDLAFHAPGGRRLEPGWFGLRVAGHEAEFEVA